jgi:hypothetical protein
MSTKQTVTYEGTNYSSMTSAELKKILEERKIDGRSKLTKKDTMVRVLELFDKDPQDKKSISSLVAELSTPRKRNNTKSEVEEKDIQKTTIAEESQSEEKVTTQEEKEKPKRSRAQTPKETKKAESEEKETSEEEKKETPKKSRAQKTKKTESEEKETSEEEKKEPPKRSRAQKPKETKKTESEEKETSEEEKKETPKKSRAQKTKKTESEEKETSEEEKKEKPKRSRAQKTKKAESEEKETSEEEKKEKPKRSRAQNTKATKKAESEEKETSEEEKKEKPKRSRVKKTKEIEESETQEETSVQKDSSLNVNMTLDDDATIEMSPEELSKYVIEKKDSGMEKDSYVKEGKMEIEYKESDSIYESEPTAYQPEMPDPEEDTSMIEIFKLTRHILKQMKYLTRESQKDDKVKSLWTDTLNNLKSDFESQLTKLGVSSEDDLSSDGSLTF